MTVTVEGIFFACGGLLSVFAVTAIGVRLVLIPYLREHLVKPVAQVQHQVTVNHHSSEEPTLLDRFDDLSTQVSEVRQEQREQRAQITDVRRDIGGVRQEQRIQRQEQADQSERINGMAARLTHHIDGTPE